MGQVLFGRFEFARVGASATLASRLLRAALIGLPLVIGGATTEAQTLASLPSPSQALERNGSARPVAAWVALGGEPARTVVSSRSVRKAAAGPTRR